MTTGKLPTATIALVVRHPGSADDAIARHIQANLEGRLRVEIAYTHEGDVPAPTRIDPVGYGERVASLFSGRYDLVHFFDRYEVQVAVHSLAAASIVAPEDADLEDRFLSVPITASIHDLRGTDKAGVDDIWPILAVMTAAYAVSSPLVAQTYAAIDELPLPSAIIPDGLDISFSQSLVTQPHKDAPSRVVIGWLDEPSARPSRADEQMPALLVPAVAALRARGHDVHVATGDTDDLWMLNVRACEYLASLDALVMAWTQEARAGLALAAMALEIPVVATRVCLPGDLSPSQQGVSLGAADSTSIAEALDVVIGDAGFRATLTAQNAAGLAAADWPVVAGRWQSFFEDVLRSSDAQSGSLGAHGRAMRRAQWQHALTLALANHLMGRNQDWLMLHAMSPAAHTRLLREEVVSQDTVPREEAASRTISPIAKEPPKSRRPVSAWVAPDRSRPASFRQRVEINEVTVPQARPMVLAVTLAAAGADLSRVGGSLVRQSVQAWRWVVAGDAGRLADRDPRVLTLVDLASQGTIERLNSEVRASDAPYIAVLDPRDELDPTTLERWVWCLESTPTVTWVRSRYVIGWAETTAVPVPVEAGLDFVADTERSTSFLMRRDELLAIGGIVAADPTDTIVEEIWLRLARKGSWGSELVSTDLTTSPRTDDERDRVKLNRVQLASRFKEAIAKDTALSLGRRPNAYRLPARLPEDVVLANPVRTRDKRFVVLLPYITPGGTEKVVLDIVAQLSARGWHASVVVTGAGDAGWAPRFREHTDDLLHLEWFLTPENIDSSHGIHFPRFMKYLVDSRDPDVIIISNSAIGFGCVPWLREAAPDVTILGIHHAAYWPPLAAEFAQALDGILVSYRALASQFVANGVSAERVHHFYTGVDTAKWHPDAAAKLLVRRELGTPVQSAVLLFVGRWSLDKRPWLVGEIAIRLAARGHRVEAWIVGDGPESERVRAVASQAEGRVDVRILGEVSDEALQRLVPAADVMVIPSEHEGIAVAAFEALACEVPFIGADVGGQRELVTADCGILIRPSDADRELASYVDAVDSLLSDAARLRRMGRAGRRRVVEGFTIEKMADRVESVIALASGLNHDRASSDQQFGRFAASLSVALHHYERNLNAVWAHSQNLERIIGAQDLASAESATGTQSIDQESIQRSGSGTGILMRGVSRVARQATHTCRRWMPAGRSRSSD